MADISKIKTPSGDTYDIKVSRNKVGSTDDSHTDGLDPVAQAMILDHSANKTFGLPASQITIEYSTDGGATWVDYGATDTQKKCLFSETRSVNFFLGKNTTRKTATTSHRLRVTIAHDSERYVELNALYVWLSDYGNTMYMDMEKSTNGSPDSFTTVFSGQRVDGWPGANIRYFSPIRFGAQNQSGNANKIRLTFYQTAVSTTYGASNVMDIRFYGNAMWIKANSMMATNHMYSWDANMNVTFPAKVTATEFDGSVTKANQLTNARTIDGVDFDGTAAITHYGTCSTAAGTAAKVVDIDGFKLVTGAVVWVRFTVTNSAAVANLTLNVNDTGAKHIKYRGGNLGSVEYLAAGRTYPFVYDGTYWELACDIDTTTNIGNNIRANCAVVRAGTEALELGEFIVAGTDGLYIPLNSGNAFDIRYPIFREGTATAAGEISTNNFYATTAAIAETQDMTLTPQEPIYIKGHLSDTTFTPVSTTPLTQTVPTTADGYQYMFLGVAYSAIGFWLSYEHPIYHYRDGSFTRYEELPDDTLDVQKQLYIQQLKDLCLFAQIANESN